MSTPLKRAREEDSRAVEVDPTSPAGDTVTAPASATTRRPCRRCGRIFSARGLPTHTAACKRKAALAAKVKKPLSAAQIAAFARRKATLARRKAALEEELAERRAAEARAAALRLEAAARLEDWERAERLRLKLRAAQAGEREAEVKAGRSRRLLENAEAKVGDLERQLERARAAVEREAASKLEAEAEARKAGRKLNKRARIFARVEATITARGAGAEAAYSRLGELFVDVLPIVAGVGFAVDVARCRFLCGTTFRKGDKGATNDMFVQALRLQAPWAETVRREPKRLVFLPHIARHVAATPLATAVLTENLPRTLQLLALGAPLHTLSTEGKTALHVAVRYEPYLACGQAILAHIALLEPAARLQLVNQRDSAGTTALAMAFRKRWTYAVEALIRHGADVTLSPPNSSVLHEMLQSDFAGEARDKSLIWKIYFSRGFRSLLAVKDASGRTPLEFARFRGKSELVLDLLR